MNEIQKGIEILKNGGIVIFPTDTAFGIGCRIDKESSIEKLFEIRNRPKTQAVPVLFDSTKMLEDYVEEIPEQVQNLMQKYWPGALTIVLPCKTDKVPALVRGGGLTLGVRVPNNRIVLELIKGVRAPILGPSANLHGKETPYRFEDLDPDLVRLTDFVIEGETSEGNVSTVIDCSVKPWKILRQGAVEVTL